MDGLTAILVCLKDISTVLQEVPYLRALTTPHHWPTIQTCTWKQNVEELDKITKKRESCIQSALQRLGSGLSSNHPSLSPIKTSVSQQLPLCTNYIKQEEVPVKTMSSACQQRSKLSYTLSLECSFICACTEIFIKQELSF